MPSNINPSNINGNFPVAGQGNDSQGFRTNFTNIRTNMSFARAEIEELQQKAVLKEAISGSSLDNNMDGAELIKPKLVAATEKLIDLGAVSGNIIIDTDKASVFIMTTSGSLTIDFSGWPAAGTYAKVRIILNVQNVTHSIVFPPSIGNSIDTIAGFTPTFMLTVPNPGIYIFDASTSNGGVHVSLIEVTNKLLIAGALTNVPWTSIVGKPTFATVATSGNYADLVGKPVIPTLLSQLSNDAGFRKTIQGTQLAGNSLGDPGDVAGMMKVDANNLYVCVANYDGVTTIWKKIALTNI